MPATFWLPHNHLAPCNFWQTAVDWMRDGFPCTSCRQSHLLTFTHLDRLHLYGSFGVLYSRPLKYYHTTFSDQQAANFSSLSLNVCFEAEQGGHLPTWSVLSFRTDRRPHCLAWPILVGKYRRQRRIDLCPEHARRQHCQRVLKVDHLFEPGTEKNIAYHRFSQVSLIPWRSNSRAS
jgi:hypothetical protein